MTDKSIKRTEKFMRHAMAAHGGSVYLVALAQTRSEADAQDVAQDVFCRLLTDSTAFTSDEQIVAVFLCDDKRRKHPFFADRFCEVKQRVCIKIAARLPWIFVNAVDWEHLQGVFFAGLLFFLHGRFLLFDSGAHGGMRQRIKGHIAAKQRAQALSQSFAFFLSHV